MRIRRNLNRRRRMKKRRKKKRPSKSFSTGCISCPLKLVGRGGRELEDPVIMFSNQDCKKLQQSQDERTFLPSLLPPLVFSSLSLPSPLTRPGGLHLHLFEHEKFLKNRPAEKESKEKSFFSFSFNNLYE